MAGIESDWSYRNVGRKRRENLPYPDKPEIRLMGGSLTFTWLDEAGVPDIGYWSVNSCISTGALS